MTTATLKPLAFFERYLTVWVGLCILGGILLGKVTPGFAQSLDGLALHVKGAPVVSIPIAICLFFMMYPIMVKIDFASVLRAGRSGKPVLLTLFVNWAIKLLIEVPVMLMLVGFCQRTAPWFDGAPGPRIAAAPVRN